MTSVHLVIVSINGEDFGVDITQVKEIIKPIEIFKVPTAPDYFEGLVNLRGKVYSIFNLRKKLGLPSRQFDDDTRFVIVNKNSEPLGFIVDQVKEIAAGEKEGPEGLSPKSPAQIKEYVTGAAKIGNRQIFILNINKVLSVTTADSP